MPAHDSISSLQNPRIKNVVRLANRRQRERLRQTVVEGIRESTMALQHGVVPIEAFICPQYLHTADGEEVEKLLHDLGQSGRTDVIEVTRAVYDKMAYRAGSGGVLLVVPFLTRSLDDLELRHPALIAIVDGAEKPGNVGAILRTADAAGVDALVLTGSGTEGTDIHNPNAIRASLGTIFTVPVAAATPREAATWCAANGIMMVAAAPDAAHAYTSISYCGPVAIVLGSEADGLGSEWLQTVDVSVRIPMLGTADSLNLSVSAAVILYEVVRQRSAAAGGSAMPLVDA